MNNDKLVGMPIGQIVVNDYRSSTVFREFGLDFCCGGGISLEEGCQKKGINIDAIVAKLNALDNVKTSVNQDFKEWDPAFLCDYIMNVHHHYVRRILPDLDFYTKKIAKVHGLGHPELVEVESLFSEVAKELIRHLEAEESQLFPAIKDAFKSGDRAAFETIKKELDGYTAEHQFVGGALARIAELTNNYSVPADACNTYGVTLKLLREFEEDLHLHVHLENNILFEKIATS